MFTGFELAPTVLSLKGRIHSLPHASAELIKIGNPYEKLLSALKLVFSELSGDMLQIIGNNYIAFHNENTIQFDVIWWKSNNISFN